MANADKQRAREGKSKAYRDLARSLAHISDVYRPTPGSIYDCLSKAHLSEKNAVSTVLSREELFREAPEAEVPDELSDKAISGHFASAGNLYESAAVDSLATADLPRAFRYYRRAVANFGRAAGLQRQCDDALLEKIQQCKKKTAVVRQELAKRTRCRKRLSLGFLKRRR
jgi:hypothetical protein